jgi:8-oxo-dGTP diphosphatase
MSESSPEAEPVVPVVAAVVERGGRFLVCRRPDEKRHGGLWEFPGGKLRPGEDLLAAARRELGEELDLAVSRLGRELFRARDPGSRFLVLFVEVEAAGVPRRLEHSELGWFSPDDLTRLELAPTDALFVRSALPGQR